MCGRDLHAEFLVHWAAAISAGPAENHRPRTHRTTVLRPGAGPDSNSNLMGVELGAGPNPNPNWCCSPGLATVLMWTFRGELTRVFLLCCGAFTIQFLAPLEVQVKLIEFIIKEYMHAQVRFQKTEIRHAGLPRA